MTRFYAIAGGVAAVLLLLAVAYAIRKPPEMVCVNVGAACRVYLCSTEAIQARFTELAHPGAVTQWHAGQPVAVYLPADPASQHDRELVRLTIHEISKHCRKLAVSDFDAPGFDASTCAIHE